jgi:hypothetical protein
MEFLETREPTTHSLTCHVTAYDANHLRGPLDVYASCAIYSLLICRSDNGVCGPIGDLRLAVISSGLIVQLV